MESKPIESKLENNEKPSLRILVADDREDLKEALALTLEEMGCAVDTVSDGKELIEKFNSKKNIYNFIITDFEMPNIDGLEAFKIIRETEKLQRLPEIPILIVTGNSFKLEDEMTRRGLVAPYLGKPFRLEQLKKKIEDLIPPETTSTK